MIESIVEITTDKDGKELERALTWAEFEAEQRALHGDDFYRAGPPASRKGDDTPVYRVTRWVPFEASLVAIPADTTVGVGRGVEAPQVEQEQVKQMPTITPATPAIVITQGVRAMEKTPAELDDLRRAAIIALGEQFAAYVAHKDIADALRNGRTAEQFKDLIIEKMTSKHSDTSGMHIGLTGREVQRYSLGRALQASLTGDWSKAGFERECSQAVEGLFKQSPEGFYMPFDVFRRDFNVGTGTEAGNLVPTDLRTDMFVDALRNSLVMGKLGVRILAGLSGNVDLPRKATASTVGRLAEIGSASETNPLTAKVTLSPKRVGGYIEVSKQAIIQSAIALEGMMKDDLLLSAAVELENQVINGNGTAPNILGIRATTGIGTVLGGTHGLAPSWAHLVDLESACANSNAEPDRLAGYLINTKARGAFKKTQKATNLPFIWDNGEQPLNGYRAGITNNVPSNLTKGTSTTICSAGLFSSDWSMEVIGVFGAPDVVVDPFTKADTGQVKITLNTFNDAGCRQPAAFSKVDDWIA
jgi:HK97 family phage major capsid protein